MDWNPVVHLLDELSDGTRLFAELRHIISHHDRASCLQSVLFLADRDLIELSEQLDGSEPIPKADWPALLSEAFERKFNDSGGRANACIHLTKRSEQVLQLLGIGHP